VLLSRQVLLKLRRWGFSFHNWAPNAIVDPFVHVLVFRPIWGSNAILDSFVHVLVF
jgi:hypothetical protein